MSGLAEEELTQAGWVVWVRRGGGALLLLVVLAGIYYVAKELAAPTGPRTKQMAKIKIVPDTPPPPPPPKEERKPEPPKEVKENRPEPPKDQPRQQEAQPLKMEGQGSENGLAGVQAGTVRSDYIGQKTGDGGNRFGAYLSMVQQELSRALQKIDQLRSADYRVVVRLWLGADGSVARAELAGSTGSKDVDEHLRQALAQVPALRERPPEGMPQPVKVRLTSR